MQRLLARPALCRTFSPASHSRIIPAAPFARELHSPKVSSSHWVDSKRAFGSERQWSPRCQSDTQEPLPVATEKYNDGPQCIEFWENSAGALVAQHDELEDIESCRWAIRCTCERLRQSIPNQTVEQKSRQLMALRFLLDLEEKVEKLSDEGFGTCAIDIFERPWVLMCGDDEILRLRPRPDSVYKRLAFAALGPVLAPAGALVTYVKSGKANGIAALKWYFRAVAELPSTVQLDNSYRLEGSYTDLEACASSSSIFSDLRNLIRVQRTVPQLSV